MIYNRFENFYEVVMRHGASAAAAAELESDISLEEAVESASEEEQVVNDIAPEEIWNEMLSAIESDNNEEFDNLLRLLCSGEESYVEAACQSFQELDDEVKQRIIEYKDREALYQFAFHGQKALAKLLLDNAAPDKQPVMLAIAGLAVLDNSDNTETIAWLLEEFASKQEPEMIIAKHLCTLLMAMASEDIEQVNLSFQKLDFQQRDAVIGYTGFFMLRQLCAFEKINMVEWLLENANPEQKSEMVIKVFGYLLVAKELKPALLLLGSTGQYQHKELVQTLLDMFANGELEFLQEDEPEQKQELCTILFDIAIGNIRNEYATADYDYDREIIRLLLAIIDEEQKQEMIQDLFTQFLKYRYRDIETMDLLFDEAELGQKQVLVQSLSVKVLEDVNSRYSEDDIGAIKLLLRNIGQKQKLDVILRLFKAILQHIDKSDITETIELLLSQATEGYKEKIIQALLDVVTTEHNNGHINIKNMDLLLKIIDPSDDITILQKLFYVVLKSIKAANQDQKPEKVQELFQIVLNDISKNGRYVQEFNEDFNCVKATGILLKLADPQQKPMMIQKLFEATLEDISADDLDLGTYFVEEAELLLKAVAPKQRPKMVQDLFEQISTNISKGQPSVKATQLLLKKAKPKQKPEMVQKLFEIILKNIKRDPELYLIKAAPLLLEKAEPEQKPEMVQKLFKQISINISYDSNFVKAAKPLYDQAEPWQKPAMIQNLLQGILRVIRKGQSSVKATALLLEIAAPEQKPAIMVEGLFMELLKHKEKCAGIETMGVLFQSAILKQKQEIIESLPSMISEYIKQEKGIKAIKSLLKNVQDPVGKKMIIEKLFSELKLSEGSDIEEFLQDELNIVNRQLSMAELFAKKDKVRSELCKAYQYCDTPTTGWGRARDFYELTVVLHHGKKWAAGLLFPIEGDSDHRSGGQKWNDRQHSSRSASDEEGNNSWSARLSDEEGKSSGDEEEKSVGRSR